MGAGASGLSEQRAPERRHFEVFEMHIVIYALVEASTHDDALATGKTVFDRLVGADSHAGAVFDYYVCFDEEDTSVAGKARWGELPTAAPVDSDDGQDLLNRGWFNDERKQTPSRFPERIGVVTSLHGDARDDLQSAIHGQDPTVDILVRDACVQGDRAPRSIANGIHHLDRHEDVDLIIAGRGGGSDTDLKAFNTEAVAEALFTASTPTVTAVGQTDDRFIADKVADMAAITPTRAGEYFAGSRAEFVDAKVDPLERALEDAYQTFEQEYEHDRELAAGERKLTYYKVAVAVLVLLLLAVILWQVV